MSVVSSPRDEVAICAIVPVSDAKSSWFAVYVVSPVPPWSTATVVPCHVPAVMVPTVVMLLVPAHVDSVVFSTRSRASVALRFAVVVPARVFASDAYSTFPCVYVVRPVPPLPTVNVPVVSDIAMLSVDVATFSHIEPVNCN